MVHGYATPRNTRCHHLRVSTSCQLNWRARFSFQPWMHQPAGMPAGLIARTAASTGTTRAALAATRVRVAEATADAGRDDQLTAALDAITGQLGPPEALIYNA